MHHLVKGSFTIATNVNCVYGKIVVHTKSAKSTNIDNEFIFSYLYIRKPFPDATFETETYKIIRETKFAEIIRIDRNSFQRDSKPTN